MVFSSKFLDAIKAIYKYVKSAVKLNGHMTEWFTVNIGLKQGCLLSPVLFTIFFSSLISDIKCMNIDINGEKIGILLYADDIVLLTENEKDSQLLDMLYMWCRNKSLR